MSRAPPCERRISVGTRGRESTQNEGFGTASVGRVPPRVFTLVDPLLVIMVGRGACGRLDVGLVVRRGNAALSRASRIRSALAARQHRERSPDVPDASPRCSLPMEARGGWERRFPRASLAGVIDLPTTAATPSDSPVNSRPRDTCVPRQAGISAAATRRSPCEECRRRPMWRSRLVDLVHCGRRTSCLSRGSVREQSRLNCLELALGERAFRPQPRDSLSCSTSSAAEGTTARSRLSRPAPARRVAQTGGPSNRRRDQGPPYAPIRRLRPTHTAHGCG